MGRKYREFDDRALIYTVNCSNSDNSDHSNPIWMSGFYSP